MSNLAQQCQYCGATIDANASFCEQCGQPLTAGGPSKLSESESKVTSVTSAIPPPAFSTPKEPASILETQSRALSPLPSSSLSQLSTPPKRPVNKGTAIILEILGGLFGFLGIGWIYAGKVGLGVVLLLVYLFLLGLVTIGAIGSGGAGVVCICFINPLLPIISGLMLSSNLKGS